MKNIKIFFKKLILHTLCVLSLLSCITVPSYAADQNKTEKFETFISDIITNGYINSTISITQKSNSLYHIDFLFKENTMAIDYGFYLYPSVVKTLNAKGYKTEVKTDNEYAYVSFSTNTRNLKETLTELSSLPYVNLIVAEDNSTKDKIIKIEFNKDFYKEEKEKDQLVADIFSTNTFVVKYKPYSDIYIDSPITYKDEQGYYLYSYTDSSASNSVLFEINKIPAYSLIVKKLNALANLLLPVTSIALVIVIIIKIKLKNKYGSSYSGYSNDDENNYYDDEYDDEYDY